MEWKCIYVLLHILTANLISTFIIFHCCFLMIRSILKIILVRLFFQVACAKWAEAVLQSNFFFCCTIIPNTKPFCKHFVYPLSGTIFKSWPLIFTQLTFLFCGFFRLHISVFINFLPSSSSALGFSSTSPSSLSFKHTTSTSVPFAS